MTKSDDHVLIINDNETKPKSFIIPNLLFVHNSNYEKRGNYITLGIHWTYEPKINRWKGHFGHWTSNRQMNCTQRHGDMMEVIVLEWALHKLVESAHARQAAPSHSNGPHSTQAQLDLWCRASGPHLNIFPLLDLLFIYHVFSLLLFILFFIIAFHNFQVTQMRMLLG